MGNPTLEIMLQSQAKLYKEHAKSDFIFRVIEEILHQDGERPHAVLDTTVDEECSSIASTLMIIGSLIGPFEMLFDAGAKKQLVVAAVDEIYISFCA